MIKNIDIADIKIGMYVHDLNCDWTSHPFFRKRFLIKNDAEIAKIVEAGIHELYIDTEKGLDVSHARSVDEVNASLQQQMIEAVTSKPAPIIALSFAEELGRANRIKSQAHALVKTVMQDVRLGRAVELEQVEPMIESITESVLSNSGALLTLLRIKNKDDYTFLHSVSVGTLMIAFCRSVGMDMETIHLAGLGGILHDTGKALVPDEILNKPGRLTEEEFDIIKRHPRDGFDILSRTEGISEIPLDITLHHHERVDGSGYPHNLKGDTISTLAKMAAIVDVYDAITADRCYHKGMAPTDALRKIFEWSKYHFDPKLVQAFMRCVGIYPVGTLVLLESGKLGVVIEQHDSNLLTPKIKVMFSSKSNTYLQPEIIDLSRPLGFGGGDKIVRHEAPEKWGINPLRFM
ncbi:MULTISPECIES: HD-GYP domain-containing protein [Vogesella]|uniref:Putative nucleotidyltransferase with HDIG domain n=1 Tax=Vogesella indigofera TaxID=45465 RepID=A0A495AW31_VOGIN|nr:MULTISPECIES: HD-GYP domain-containing protein [Vogesella]MCQ4145344.1 HD-GYP domain-containing protein [Vogesella sp. AC12]RKQ52938.1 putative nucleotidyltransferase with HDIG domain [Vogesella indigofera]